MSKENNELVVLEEVVYPVSTDEIKSFLAEWKDVPTLDPLNEDKEPYKLVKKAHLAAVKFRTTIEAKRKLLKSPALAYGKQVDSIAKEFQEMINPKELELFAERSKVDQYEKEQEQLRIDAERERVENIGHAITALKMIPLDTMGKTSQELTDVYESIVIPSEEIYAERFDEAILTYKDTLSKLELAIETTTKAEQAESIQAEAEAKRKAEEAVLAEDRKKEREVFEKEKAEFADMKAKQERKAKTQQEDINRQKAERDANDLAKRQAIEAKEKAEQIEKLKLEKEKEDAELFKSRFNETLESMIGFDTKEDLLDAILDNMIPNIGWVV